MILSGKCMVDWLKSWIKTFEIYIGIWFKIKEYVLRSEFEVNLLNFCIRTFLKVYPCSGLGYNPRKIMWMD